MFFADRDQELYNLSYFSHGEGGAVPSFWILMNKVLHSTYIERLGIK